MGKLIKGGCLCKKIRYKACAEPKWISICHCRMCQKAYGNTSATFVAFDAGQLEFTSGLPKYFQSSEIAKRGFCSECGSPIVFSYQSVDAVFIGDYIYATAYKRVNGEFIKVGNVLGQKVSSFILFEDNTVDENLNFAWHLDMVTKILKPFKLTTVREKDLKLPSRLDCISKNFWF